MGKTAGGSGLIAILAALVVIVALIMWPSRTVGSDSGASPAQQGETPAQSPTVPGDSKATERASVAKKKSNGNVAQWSSALAMLATIPVKGRAPKTGYDRERFGQAWSDAAGNFAWSRNGCDTRNDLLARDLSNREVKTGTHDCVVVSGTLLYEPYTGQLNRRFACCDDDYATDLDAEHVVPLSWAWQHGAAEWAPEKRAAFANAPGVLIMVDPSQNRQHSDSGPGAWLPRNKAYRCAYASRWVLGLNKWGLWVNRADHDALARILNRCV